MVKKLELLRAYLVGFPYRRTPHFLRFTCVSYSHNLKILGF